MLNKGQIKDKTEFQTKRKLSNGFKKPFESSVDGDPYGNRKCLHAFRTISECYRNRITKPFYGNLPKTDYSAFQQVFAPLADK